MTVCISTCSRQRAEKPDFDISDREYRVVSWHLLDEPKGDALIELFHRTTLIREFICPAYKIWNIAAHFADIVDSEIASDDHGYRLAAWNGIGPL